MKKPEISQAEFDELWDELIDLKTSYKELMNEHKSLLTRYLVVTSNASSILDLPKYSPVDSEGKAIAMQTDQFGSWISEMDIKKLLMKSSDFAKDP